MKHTLTVTPKTLEAYDSAYDLIFDYDFALISAWSEEEKINLQHFDDFEAHKYFLVNSVSVLVSDLDRVVCGFETVEEFLETTRKFFSEE